MQTGPMASALETRVPKNCLNKTSRANATPVTIPLIQTESDETSGANATPVTIPLIQTESVTSTKHVQPSESTPMEYPSGDQPPPSSQVPEDDVSDSLSYTSTLPDVFDVGMDDSAPPATGPWTIIDHLTGEMIVDEEVPSAAPPVPDTPYDSIIQVVPVPWLGAGATALAETSPPALLYVDKDERPDWLTRSIKERLQYTPYFMCLGKVVDLFLTQEARLGYPAKVFTFHSCVFVR